MSAVALIEMFDNEAPQRALERACEYENGAEGACFWKLVADAGDGAIVKEEQDVTGPPLRPIQIAHLRRGARSPYERT